MIRHFIVLPAAEFGSKLKYKMSKYHRKTDPQPSVSCLQTFLRKFLAQATVVLAIFLERPLLRTHVHAQRGILQKGQELNTDLWNLITLDSNIWDTSLGSEVDRLLQGS